MLLAPYMLIDKPHTYPLIIHTNSEFFSLCSALHFCGFVFDKKHVTSFSPIKQLGKTIVKLSLHKDVEAEIEVEVVSENPIEQS